MEQQNTATSSHGRLASKSVQHQPSVAPSRPIIMDSSHLSRSTNRCPDACEDINLIRAERRQPASPHGREEGPRDVRDDIEAIQVAMRRAERRGDEADRPSGSGSLGPLCFSQRIRTEPFLERF